MVTYEHITWRATLFGTMFGGNEEWSTGFFIGNVPDGDTGVAPTVPDAEAIAAAWSTFFTTSSSGVSGEFKAVGCKIALVGTNGQANPGNTVYHYYPVPVAGGSAGSALPPQIALVATLTTAKARGYASKGRMYLPGIRHAVDNTGHMSITEQNNIRTNMKTFLDAVNLNITQDYRVVVNSALAVGIPGHPAEMANVTGVKIGNVYDTQRRRRNQLVESYVAGVLA